MKDTKALYVSVKVQASLTPMQQNRHSNVFGTHHFPFHGKKHHGDYLFIMWMRTTPDTSNLQLNAMQSQHLAGVQFSLRSDADSSTDSVPKRQANRPYHVLVFADCG